MIGVWLSDYEQKWIQHVLEQPSRMLALITQRAELRNYWNELQERYRIELIGRLEQTCRAAPTRRRRGRDQRAGMRLRLETHSVH